MDNPAVNATGNSVTPISNATASVKVKSVKRVYKIVLTGGPCGGKSTGQDRLATFFEDYGWKVFRVPETATILLKGGVRFADLSPEQVERFQEDLLLTLLRIEDVYFHLAESVSKDERNVLIICDRGAMDGSAYIESATWEKILARNSLNSVELRDKRYDQVIHMMTAAIGAQSYYTVANNSARKEDTKLAAELDRRTQQVWLGHPYVDVIDNVDTRNFNEKILKLIQVVCDRAGVLHYGDRLHKNSKKRKFLVSSIREKDFPTYQEFDVSYHYLSVSQPNEQAARIRKRGQHEKFFYTHQIRRMIAGEHVDTRMQISKREYQALKNTVDALRNGIKNKKRCFLYGQSYFQLDIYKPPIPRGMKSLMILETYTTDTTPDFVRSLPPFVKVDREITGDPQYSLYNLSLIRSKTGNKVPPTCFLM